MTPLFVVGAQRSGTTIVAECLAAQPDVGLAVNGKLAYYLVIWLLNNQREIAAGHVRMDEVAHAMRRVMPRNVPEPRLTASLESLLSYAPSLLATESPRGAVERIWRRYYSSMFPSACVIGEKYNELLFHMTPLREAFPEARFLFVFREPLDVVESMVRHFRGRPWAPRTLAEAFAKYVAFNGAWEVARQELASDRYFELSYEEFVEDSTAALARACAHLGVPPPTNPEPMLNVKRHYVGKGADCDTAQPVAAAARLWYDNALSRVTARAV